MWEGGSKSPLPDGGGRRGASHGVWERTKSAFPGLSFGGRREDVYLRDQLGGGEMKGFKGLALQRAARTGWMLVRLSFLGRRPGRWIADEVSETEGEAADGVFEAVMERWARLECGPAAAPTVLRARARNLALRAHRFAMSPSCCATGGGNIGAISRRGTRRGVGPG